MIKSSIWYQFIKEELNLPLKNFRIFYRKSLFKIIGKLKNASKAVRRAK